MNKYPYNKDDHLAPGFGDHGVGDSLEKTWKKHGGYRSPKISLNDSLAKSLIIVWVLAMLFVVAFLISYFS